MTILARLCVVLVLALAMPFAAFAADISPSQAASFIGQSVTVTGKVSEVHTDENSGNTFINMGGRYPNHKFYAVVFSNYAAKFRNLGSLEGATVSITGTIQDYRGKPQIILNSPSQITVH